MQKIAIFDVDNTIINGQSQKYLLSYAFQHGMIPFLLFLKINIWFILYKIGFAKNPESIINNAYSFIKNFSMTDIDDLASKVFDERIKKQIYIEAVNRINLHKTNGDRIILLSNSTDIIISKIANFLDIEEFICTRLEEIGGVYTGKITGKINYGENKVTYIKEFLNINSRIISNAYFYSDHISDYPLLSSVEFPVVVNPDRKLHRIAKKNHWDVLIFN